jgi:hypothetical protein
MSKHQTLMTAAYQAWGDGMSYMGFLDELDGTSRRAVVFGNLNREVHNGGFDQWHDNGYSEAGEFLLRSLEKMTGPAALKVKGIMEKVFVQIHIHEQKEADWEEAEDMDFDTLDIEYYTVADAFLKEAESFFLKVG